MWYNFEKKKKKENIQEPPIQERRLSWKGVEVIFSLLSKPWSDAYLGSLTNNFCNDKSNLDENPLIIDVPPVSIIFSAMGVLKSWPHYPFLFIYLFILFIKFH